MALGYLGLRFFAKRKDDIWNVITNIGDIKLRLPKRKRRTRTAKRKEGADIEVAPEFYYSIPKILDTSAIIDGRILDVAQSGFLEGTIVLPRFILAELQGVADSTDPLRRTRGRRGLAVVTELQKASTLNIEIPETTLKDLERDKVDEALVVLARQLGGKVITTDYNLNQIAQIEGVSVLNVNDLANSLDAAPRRKCRDRHNPHRQRTCIRESDISTTELCLSSKTATKGSVRGKGTPSPPCCRLRRKNGLRKNTPRHEQGDLVLHIVAGGTGSRLGNSTVPPPCGHSCLEVVRDGREKLWEEGAVEELIIVVPEDRIAETGEGCRPGSPRLTAGGAKV